MPDSSDSDSQSELSPDSDDSLFESYSFMYQSAAALLVALDEMQDDDEEDNFQQSVDPNVGVRDVLGQHLRCPSIFRTMSNFTLEEFEVIAISNFGQL